MLMELALTVSVWSICGSERNSRRIDNPAHIVFPMNVHQALEIGAIAVAGTMTGNEMAVAFFVHPRVSRLDDETHVKAVQTLASGLGKAMPFWYALTLLLSLAVTFISHSTWDTSRWLALSATALFAAMIVYSLLLPVPINDQVARWKPDSLPSNWRALRQRWDTLHAIRVGILTFALLLLIASCV